MAALPNEWSRSSTASNLASEGGRRERGWREREREKEREREGERENEREGRA